MNQEQKKILLEEKSDLQTQRIIELILIMAYLGIILGTWLFRWSILWTIISIIGLLFINPTKTKSKIREIDYKFAGGKIKKK